MKTYRIVRRVSVTGKETFKIQVKRLWWWKDVTEQYVDDVDAPPQVKWHDSIMTARAWISARHPQADIVIETILVY